LLIIVDNTSLMGSKMLTFIDHIVCLVKQTHNQFMNGFDIIKSLGDFFQTILIRDS
jgi:hypothetical protein